MQPVKRGQAVRSLSRKDSEFKNYFSDEQNLSIMYKRVNDMDGADPKLDGDPRSWEKSNDFKEREVFKNTDFIFQKYSTNPNSHYLLQTEAANNSF